MTEQSVKFNIYDDICTRPKFNSECEISTINFKQLVGPYVFSDEHICQVRTDSGICRQRHKAGWLGITKDGVEALIGGMCANKYFHASTDFIMEKNRVLDELARKEAIEKMSGFLCNKLAVARELLELEQAILSIKNKISDVYKMLPNDVLTFLYQSQRTTNWDVFVDVKYSKEIKSNAEDKKVEKWIASRLGKVKPLSPVESIERLHEKSIQLKKFYNTFSTVIIDDLAEVKTPQIKKYLKRIEEKRDLEKSLIHLRSEFDNFVANDNLELLLYTCDSSKEQFYATQAIMKLTGFKAEYNAHIERRLVNIISRFERKFEGRMIRKSIAN